MDKQEILSALAELPVAYSNDYTREVWPVKKAAKKADEVPAITSVQSPTTTTEHKDFFSSIASSMSHHLGTNATSEGMKELRNTYAGTLGTMSYSELSALEVQLAAYVQSVQ